MMFFFKKIKSLFKYVLMLYVKRVCKQEYSLQSFSNINERPIEFAFLFRQLVNLWPKKVLDVGAGMTSLPHLMRNCGFHVTATDNIKDYWPRGMINRHYHVLNDDITQTTLTDSYDVITCVSVLEHIKEHQEAIKSMYKLLVPGGRLILTCPYNEESYAENVYALPESSVTENFAFITQAFSRKELDSWLGDTSFKVIEQEYWDFFEGEYWTCGERIIPPRRVEVHNRHQLTCLLLQKPE